MFDFRSCTTFSRGWFRVFKCRQQSLSLGINPIDNAVPCYTHGNIDGDHSCHECKKSNKQSVCGRLESICGSSCKFVHGAKNVKSTNSRHVQAFEDILWAYFGQFSDRFQFFPFEVMVVRARGWDFVQLLNLFGGHFDISFHALLRIIFQVTRPSHCFCVKLFPSFVFLNVFVRFTLTLSTSQIHVVKKWCRFSKVNQLRQFLPHGTKMLLSSSHFFMSSTYTEKNNPRVRCTTGDSQFGTFSHPRPRRTFYQIVFPTAIQQMDDHTHFVQEEPLDFQCLTMI